MDWWSGVFCSFVIWYIYGCMLHVFIYRHRVSCFIWSYLHVNVVMLFIDATRRHRMRTSLIRSEISTCTKKKCTNRHSRGKFIAMCYALDLWCTSMSIRNLLLCVMCADA